MKKTVKINGFEDVPQLNEEAIMKAVANQPVSAAIEANGHDFQFYSSVTQNMKPKSKIYQT